MQTATKTHPCPEVRQVGKEGSGAADRNDTKGFHNGMKGVWGSKKKGHVHLKLTDVMKTFSDSKRVVARWSEHFQKLLNDSGDIDPEARTRS